jgi:hypothetical protein
MTRIGRAWLCCEAWLALAGYDLRYAARGFRGVTQRLERQRVAARCPADDARAAVCEAMQFATCFYGKPVRCLQRAACTVSLLRRRGIAARLVIGYRPVPFVSHAWVEVGGDVVNDSPAYQQRLQVLYAG